MDPVAGTHLGERLGRGVLAQHRQYADRICGLAAHPATVAILPFLVQDQLDSEDGLTHGPRPRRGASC